MNKVLISLLTIFCVLTIEANNPVSSHMFERIEEAFSRVLYKKPKINSTTFNSAFYEKQKTDIDRVWYGRIKLDPESDDDILSIFR